jgi:hypothetical protein
MTFIYWPDWTTANIILYTALAITAPLVGVAEYMGWSSMRYSKFRTGEGISGRTGMFLLYFAPLCAHLLATWLIWPVTNLPQQLLVAGIVFHFAKRCAESLFLHKYSGPIDVATVVQIAFFYTAISIASAYFNQTTPATADGVVWLGTAVFLLGQAGNFYHHWLLARLRTQSTGYFIPHGGWFRWVSCPHYTLELVAWLGLALITKEPFMYLTCIAMTGYLIARSLKAQAWYHERFPDYPRQRKAIIPFLI